jgi:hypothetical protein
VGTRGRGNKERGLLYNRGKVFMCPWELRGGSNMEEAFLQDRQNQGEFSQGSLWSCYIMTSFDRRVQ